MLLLELLAFGVWVGSIYTLVAIGLILVRETSGFVNFAHGATVIVAAYTAHSVTSWVSMGVILGGAFACLSGCTFAVVAEVTIFRPLRNRDSSPLTLMIASLGLLIAVQNLAALLFGSQTVTLPSPGRSVALTSGVNLSLTQIASVVGAVIAVGSLTALFRTNVGTKIRAVSDDSDLAQIFGVDRDRVIIWVTIIGALTASVAGVLWAGDNDLRTEIGFQLLLFGLVAATIGGFRGVRSAIFGGLFVGLVQYLSVWWVPTQWKDSVVFAVFMGFLVFRPSGFVGIPEDR